MCVLKFANPLCVQFLYSMNVMSHPEKSRVVTLNVIKYRLFSFHETRIEP